jgi:hypothetical protein
VPQSCPIEVVQSRHGHFRARRARRWWQTGRPIRSIGRAEAFVADVGFALLFPATSVALRRIAETLLASGPLPTAVLRQAVGLEGRRGSARFSAAVVELGRALVCTSFGTEQVGSGWPSVVLELTARAFDLGGRDAPAGQSLHAPPSPASASHPR